MEESVSACFEAHFKRAGFDQVDEVTDMSAW